MSPEILIQGQAVPLLGLGTYALRGKDCERTVETALSIGYRHIDTAQFYGNELAIGIALQNTNFPRAELFITTKVWPSNFSKRNFIPSVEKSLEELKMDYVDLLLIHWPREDNTNRETTEYLLQCHELKYAKNIGVSNFNIGQLKQAQKQAPIFCNQIEYHPYSQNVEMLEYGRKNDILVTAYSPLSVGKLRNDMNLKSIGKKYDKSSSQIALRWLVQQNIAAIPKASSPEHLKENLHIFGFELSEEDMRKISGL